MSSDKPLNDRFPNHYEILGKILFDTGKKAVVFIDKDGFIVKLNDAYEKNLNKSKAEVLGENIAKVIENTRLDIVARTGIAEINQLHHACGLTVISDRFPIFENNECVGAVGIVNFNDNSEIKNILTLFEEQQNKIQQYENELRSYRTGRYVFSDIIGSSSLITKAKNEALKAASADIDVLIQGETGTGKELFAHSIYNASKRRQEAFITINCSAITPSLAESELFGYDPGTFTGADRKGRKGKFEQANKGVILLDEIGDMPLELQPKLLRVLEDRVITRVGGSKNIHIDVMVIAATNRNLTELIKQGLFREDLYYRLSAFTITIPPLRERKQDIPLLLDHFNNLLSKTFNKPLRLFSNNSIHSLLEHNWPGNVREFYNIIKKAIINAEAHDTELSFENLCLKDEPIKSEKILKIDIATNLTDDSIDNLSDKLVNTEKNLIVEVLSKTSGNKTKTAKILGLNRCTLYRKMKKYNLV